MTILNRQITEFSITLDENTPIIIDSNTNNGGILTTNSKGNLIKDNKNGTRKITKGLIQGDSLLLHNSKEFVIYPMSFDYDTELNISKIIGKLNIKDNEDIYYKVGVSIFRTQFIGSSVTITGFNSSTHTIFKVFRNGLPTSSYTIGINGITFGDENFYTNNCEIIYYTTTQNLTGKFFELYYGTVIDN